MAAPPAPITQASDFKLPPKVSEVFANLTQEGERQFIDEMLAALESADEHDDFRSVLDVVEAWYRTLLVVRDPGFEGSLKKARKTESRRGHDVRSLRQRLGM
jgi:hypothetical protein